MKGRHKRFVLIVAAVGLLGAAAALVLSAFQSNLVFFFSPTQVHAREAPAERSFRLGGMVETGSVRKESDGLTVHFLVTDSVKTVPVVFKGILPDLFREGKGVVAEGRLDGKGVFIAHQVLAKHDENYMPPEAAEAMEKAQAVNARSAKSLVLPQEER